MSICEVILPTGTRKRVSNLGWVARRLKLVQEIRVLTNKEGGAEAWFTLNDGRVFHAHFESTEVLWDWLHRPALLGTPLYWDSYEYLVSTRAEGNGHYPWVREDAPECTLTVKLDNVVVNKFSGKFYTARNIASHYRSNYEWVRLHHPWMQLDQFERLKVIVKKNAE